MQGLKFASDGRENIIVSYSDRERKGIDLVVPEVLGSGTVTAVGFGAFRDCDGLNSIVLPNTITTIGGSAFRGCKNLTAAVLSNATHSIASNSFSDCPRLKSVTLPSTIRHIDDNSFVNCPEFTDLIITDMRKAPFEKRRFVIACKNEHRRWVYIRACLWYFDFDSMRKFDNEYNIVTSFDDQFNIAVYRLIDPEQLSEKMRQDYTKAVIAAIPRLIAEDDVERLYLAGHAGCLLPDRIDEYIDIAGKLKGECIAYLLQYKNDAFGIKEKDFTL